MKIRDGQGRQERDKIDGRKGKIPAGFLSSELYTRARGVVAELSSGS